MTILAAFLILVVIIAAIAIAVWGAGKIPWPEPLAWLRWVIPLLVMIVALIWAAQKFGVT
jgi:hypothetical protein